MLAEDFIASEIFLEDVSIVFVKNEKPNALLQFVLIIIYSTRSSLKTDTQYFFIPKCWQFSQI